MISKIVVLGSNSFSGSHFVSVALAAGIDVIGISRSVEAQPVFLPYKWQTDHCKADFTFHQLDLNQDLDVILTLIEREQPDCIVNFAAQGMVAESWQMPEDWFRTNTLSTIKLHDRLRSYQFLQKYVHISTPEVYGNCNGLVIENDHYRPSTPYAVSRAAADMSLASFYRAYDFPVVFTRAANVFGPGQQLYRIIPRTILYFLTGRKLQLHGGGQSIRSFIHIRDVCQGTLQIAQHGVVPETYHLSTTKQISIRTLVEMIAGQLDISFEDSVEITEGRLGMDNAYLLDTDKIRTTLGWKDKISLEQGIEETIAWVKDNQAVLLQQPLDYIHKP